MYTFESRVRYSEVDAELVLTPEAMINYFQDCSTFQSEDLGIGLSYLGERNIAWLVNYWQIDVLRAPRLGERIRIGTSPYEIRGFLGLRNFMMETADGERLVNVNSVWSLMNMKTMYPQRAPQEMLERYELFPKFEMEYLPRKMKLPQTEGIEASPVTIGHQHLDSNHHVNNAQYVRLALAALEESGMDPQPIGRLRVEYKRQAHLGDVLFPVCRKEGKLFSAALNNREGEPYVILEITGKALNPPE